MASSFLIYGQLRGAVSELVIQSSWLCGRPPEHLIQALSQSGLKALLFARLGGSEPGKRHRGSRFWAAAASCAARVRRLLLWEEN
jgi:hypothetical protein